MAIRNIRIYTDPLLRKKSRPVTNIDSKIIELLDDMKDTMLSKNGVGLAAPQIGVLKRIVVIDTGEGPIIEVINPITLESRGSIENEEACLSVPNKVGIVARPEYVKVRALNRYNEEIVLEGENLLAIAFCHEIDHLDGIIYLDKALSVKDIDHRSYKNYR
jgi:peptide deformylase